MVDKGNSLDALSTTDVDRAVTNAFSNDSVPREIQAVNTQNEKYSFGDPLYEKRGQGYIGKSMSVNDKLAYDNEEMPISKWSKKAILEHIDELLDEDFDSGRA